MARSRLSRARPYVLALAIFLSSRVVVYVAIAFAMVYVRRATGGDLWDAGPAWYDHLLRWDSGWYASIVDHGYVVPAESEWANNAAFYPLYPLLAKTLTLSGISTFHALLIVANVAAVAAALLLFKLAREQSGDESAYLCVAALGLFPPSVFLSAGYSEPLALVFVLGCFLLLRRQRLVSAALCAGLALATRSTGIVLVPVILWEVWKAHRTERGKLVRYGVICTLLATSGLTLFMAYLWFTVDDPLRFSSVQSIWHGGTSLRERFVSALMLKPLIDDLSEGLLYFAGCLALLLVFWRRIGTSQALYGIGVLMLPYLTLAGGPSRFGSMPRFALLAFPVFIIIGQMCKGRPWLAVIAASLGAAGLFADTAAFAQWHWSG